MASLAELRFSQKYPFTSTASNIVKERNLSLDRVPEEVLHRAQWMVSSAVLSKPYAFRATESQSVIENEVLAFPVAKILLSLSKNSSWMERFAGLIAQQSFQQLELEKSETLLDLASELNVSFALADPPYFVELSLLEYLKASFPQPFMKLVHQRVQNGKVFLLQNEFSRYLSERVRQKVLQSLPVDVKGVPESFSAAAIALAEQLTASFKKTAMMTPLGMVSPNAFPPCFADLNARLNGGENLNHVSRFNLTSFLISIGMEVESIVQLFRNAPNWNERITRYHVSRMAKGKKYSVANCETMRSYDLCIQKGALCPRIKNPMQMYRRNHREQKKAEEQALPAGEAV